MKFLREEKGVAYKIFDISELEDMALVIENRRRRQKAIKPKVMTDS